MNSTPIHNIYVQPFGWPKLLTIEFKFQSKQFSLMPKLSLVSAESVHCTLNEAPAQTRAINVEIELNQGDHK